MKRLSCLVLCLLLLCACQPTTGSLPSRTGFALDTVVSITVYDAGTASAETALDAAFAEIDRLEKLFSVTVSDSDVARINAALGQPVTVANETAELLTVASRYAQLTDGAMDVTVRPVSALWNFAEGVIPDASALAQAAALVDYRQLTVKGTTVTLAGGALELGGIAKGYIADRVAAVLSEQGVRAAVIDLGGNIVALGDKDGEAFRIGVKDPANTAELCAVIEATDLSVVTSGIYERGFDKDGVRYHHLLDPATGMPVQNELASVTVVCPFSVDADALSTACFVMGEQKARELVATLSGVEVLFVRRDGTVTATDGLSYTLA